MDSVNIHGRSLAYERQGVGKPLLLIHGFPLDHTFWLPFLPRLEASFDMILPDLPGFGLSDIPQEPFSIEEMADNLADLLDKLKVKKTTLVGHSMGGYVALAFAHRYPERVLGLGLVGSQAVPDTAERKAGRYDQAEKVLVNGPQEVAGMADKLSADPNLAPFFREIIMRQRTGGVIMALKAMANRPNASGYLATFTFPVVLIHGQEDVLISVERSREMKKLLTQAVLTELPGVGHSPPLEAPVETALALKKLSIS